MDSLQENRNDVLLKVEDLSNLILNSTFEELIEISKKNNTKLDRCRHLVSSNLENIETGVSGFLLYLLEMYKFSGKDIYLEKAELLSKNTISYCEKTDTNDYSLYCGRSGLIYVLLQLYDVNKNADLLQVCENLIIPCENEFLESKYTSDYLYDGRSGTLLILNELFQLSESERIFEIINKFITKIFQNALFTEKGISWKATEEINLNNSCGFALGASGIQYLLIKMNIDFPNNHLDYIIKYIDKHKHSCWDEKHQSWLNFEKDIINSNVLNQFKRQYLDNDPMLYSPTNELNWSKGSIGILLSENQNKKIFFELNNDKIKNLQSNIYDGLSGIGLCLLQNHSNRVIADIFFFEKKKKEYINEELKTNLQIFLDKLHHNDKIIKILNNPDQWILNQELKISQHTKIVNTKWDWEFREKHSFVQNFYNEPSNNEFIFIITNKNVAIEYSLRAAGWVLHRFDSQKKIKDALFEIKEFCTSQSEDMIKEFIENSGSKDAEDLIKRLDFLIIDKIKQLLYNNILEFV